MVIETYPEVSSENQEALKNILIANCNEINAPIENIEKIVIADKQHFGTIVERLQNEYYGENRGYTNNELYVAAAKTLSKKQDDNIISTIVFQDFVFSPYIEQPSCAEQKSFFDMCYYAIFHEFAHCIDDNHRKDYRDNRFEHENGRIIILAYKYNIEILLSEFAASVHSAKWMSEDAMGFEIDNSRDNLEKMYEFVENSKMNYLNGKGDLYHVAFNAANFFWIILIQHLKLIGVLKGLEFSDIRINSFCPNNKGKEIINKLHEVAFSIWTDYPDWTEIHRKQFLDLWFSLAKEYGYRFTCEPQGDALYFE